MHSRSLARELALLVLGQTSESAAALAEQPAMDGLLQKALDSLMLLWRETLDGSAADLERAQQSLLGILRCRCATERGADSTHPLYDHCCCPLSLYSWTTSTGKSLALSRVVSTGASRKDLSSISGGSWQECVPTVSV